MVVLIMEIGCGGCEGCVCCNGSGGCVGCELCESCAGCVGYGGCVGCGVCVLFVQGVLVVVLGSVIESAGCEIMLVMVVMWELCFLFWL